MLGEPRTTTVGSDRAARGERRHQLIYSGSVRTLMPMGQKKMWDIGQVSEYQDSELSISLMRVLVDKFTTHHRSEQQVWRTASRTIG